MSVANIGPEDAYEVPAPAAHRAPRPLGTSRVIGLDERRPRPVEPEAGAPAHGGLRDVQARGRGGEAPRLGHGDEHADQVQVHPPALPFPPGTVIERR